MEENRNPLDDIIESVNHTREWLDGFEVGILYVLMSEQLPYISGKCARNNEETIFALANRCGYTWNWSPLHGNLQSAIDLTLRSAEGNED